MVKTLSGMVIALATVSLAGHAVAQARDNFFARDRNVSVRERARPGYQALGIPLASFIAYPKVELGVQYNSNIYATQDGAISDTVGLIEPEIDLASRWSRNSVTAYVRSSTHEYDTHSGEDTTNWQFGGTGEADLGDSTLTVGGDYGYLANPRTASVGTTNVNGSTFPLHPIEYYGSDANADLAHTFNRLKVEGIVTYSAEQFQNAVNYLSAPILETPYDNSRVTASGKAAYAVSPDTALYLSAGYNSINFPNQSVAITGLNRNSTGETVDVGTNFDFTQLIRGDVEVGYLRQNFTAAGFQSLGGLHVLAKVEWFPTQLTTVTFTGSRDVVPATVPGSPAIIAGTAGGQVDHELLRNLILTGAAKFVQDDYQGIARHDKIYDVTVSGDYLVDRNVGLHLAYDNLTQDSTGALRGVNFNDNRVTLSATLQY
jgi:hypothetical protein